MDIPDILKEAHWQKHKGVVAKMVGETGMGAQLAKLKSAYASVDWAKIYPVTVYKNEQALAQARAACMQEGKKIEIVRKALYDTRDLATKVQARFRAHKLIPKASTEHVGKIIAACEMEAVKAKSVGHIVMGKFDEAEKRMLANRAMALKIVTDQVSKLRSCIQGVLKNPTSQNYMDNCWQPARTMGAAVAKAPPLAPLQPEWKVLTSIQPNSLKDAGAVKTHVQKLDALLTKTVNAAK